MDYFYLPCKSIIFVIDLVFVANRNKTAEINANKKSAPILVLDSFLVFFPFSKFDELLPSSEEMDK